MEGGIRKRCLFTSNYLKLATPSRKPPPLLKSRLGITPRARNLIEVSPSYVPFIWTSDHMSRYSDALLIIYPASLVSLRSHVHNTFGATLPRDCASEAHFGAHSYPLILERIAAACSVLASHCPLVLDYYQLDQHMHYGHVMSASIFCSKVEFVIEIMPIFHWRCEIPIQNCGKNEYFPQFYNFCLLHFVPNSAQNIRNFVLNPFIT